MTAQRFDIFHIFLIVLLKVVLIYNNLPLSVPIIYSLKLGE